MLYVSWKMHALFVLSTQMAAQLLKLHRAEQLAKIITPSGQLCISINYRVKNSIGPARD
jgi:hypothetical protein